MWLCVYGNFATALKVEPHMNCGDDSDRTRKALRKAVVDIAMTADNIDPMILEAPTFPKEMSRGDHRRARSASVARDPWRFFGAVPDHDRRSRAGKGSGRNGRGRWRKTWSQSLHQSSDRALEYLENLCRLASQQSQVRKTALFERRSSLSRSCSKRSTTRVTWVKKSFTSNVASNA